MSDWYKKHHSFRLRREDAQLFNHLEGSKNKSETIRMMLLFALEHMELANNQMSNELDLKGVVKELKEIKELQKGNHEALMNKISDGVVQGQVSEDDEEDKSDLSDESISNNRDSFFNAFNVDL